MKHFALILTLLLLGSCSAKMTWTVPARLDTADAVALVNEAAAANALPRLLEIAEETVFNTDEERMAEILRAALATGKLSESQTATAEWMLHDVCERNAPGTPAADFRFATPEISENTLYTYLPGKPLTVIFYDPDCDHCRETIAALGELGEKTDVLAVCITGDERRWRSTLSQLPTDWTPAFDRSDIMANDTYVIRSMPSVYLLDPERRVVLKNPTVDKLLNALNK